MAREAIERKGVGAKRKHGVSPIRRNMHVRMSVGDKGCVQVRRTGGRIHATHVGDPAATRKSRIRRACVNCGYI